jgi:hypothetical protein
METYALLHAQMAVSVTRLQTNAFCAIQLARPALDLTLQIALIAETLS